MSTLCRPAADVQSLGSPEVLWQPHCVQCRKFLRYVAASVAGTTIDYQDFQPLPLLGGLQRLQALAQLYRTVAGNDQRSDTRGLCLFHKLSSSRQMITRGWHATANCEKIAQMIRIFSFVLAFALASAENLYLVLQKGGSSLACYTPQGKLLANIPVGRHPHEMAFSPDRKYLYTTDNGTMRIEHTGNGGNTVSIIDVAARRKIGEISLGKYYRPHGIDVDPGTGRLAVTTENPDQLLLIDPVQRKVLRNFNTGGKTSHMVRLNAKGDTAFVSNSTSGDVSAIDLNSGQIKSIPTGTRPEGSVLSKDGKELYVCNREAASITVIDVVKKQAIANIPTGKGPVRVALTPDGATLVFAMMHDKKIGLASPSERRQTGYVLLPDTPVSLTLSHDGQFAFTSAEEHDTVYVISLKQRKIVAEIKTASGSGPDPVFDTGSK